MLEGINFEDSKPVAQPVQPEVVPQSSDEGPRKRQLDIKTGQTELSVQEEPKYELWLYDDDVPGKGPKPEFYNNKTFKTLMAQAKAQPDSRKKIQELTDKLKEYGEVPEDYILDLPEELKDFEWNKEELLEEVKELKDVAKDNKMNQESFSAVLKLFANHLKNKENEILKGHQEYVNEQLYKINPSKLQAQAKLQDLAIWMNQEFPKMDLGKVKTMLNSYDAYYVLNTIRNTKPTAQIPTGNPEKPIITRDKAREMMKGPRYLNDQKYRNYVNSQYAELGNLGLLS